MKKLSFLAVAILFFSVSIALAQENTYSAPNYFYSNIFDNNNLHSLSTYRDAGANRQSIEISTTSPLNGTASLRSVNRGTPYSNAISGQLITNNTNLDDANRYEFDFLYKYSTNNTSTAADVVDFSTGGVAAGKGGWRYWVVANNTNPSANGGLGFYFTQVGKTLSLNSKEGNFYTRGVMSYAIDPNVTYIVKFIIFNGKYRVYIDPYTNYSQTTTLRGTSNFGGGLNTYNYSVIEMDERRSANNFQFDDIKIYRPSIAITSNAGVNGTSNGITGPQLVQGQSNVIALGYNLSAVGVYTLTQLKFSLVSSGNFSTYFSSVKIYQSDDDKFSVTADNLVYTITPPGSGTVTYTTSTPVYSATYPTTKTYYFVVLDLKPDFASTSNITFNLKDVSVNYDNLNGGNTTLSATYDGQIFTGNLAYKWIGTNTNWSSNTNWYVDTYRHYSPYGANGTPQTAPPTGAYVLIPSTAAASPTVSSDLTLNGLVIESGKTLTLDNASLNVANQLTTAGDLAFTGTTSKSLTIGSTVTTSLANLSITKGSLGSSVTLTSGNANLNITNALTVTSGTLITNSHLTLKSSATTTARVAELNTTVAAISGTVNAERYVTGGSNYDASRGNYTYRNYRLMSSPVWTNTNSGFNNTSLTYIATNAIVTGATGGYTSTGNPTLYLYRENIQGTNTSFTSGNFRGVSSISTNALNVVTDGGPFYVYPGTGFLFYFRGDKTNNLTAKTTSPYVAPESVVFTNTGDLNQGPITVKNWHTPSVSLLSTTTSSNPLIQGLNVVGNPYASSINWDTAAGFTTTNVSTTIYLFNPVNNQYDSYTRGAGGAGSGGANQNIIVSGQGFFVKAATPGTAASLTFLEAAKSSTQLSASTNLLLGTPVTSGGDDAFKYIRIRLKKDSLNNDNVLLGFDPNASEKFIETEDALDMGGNGALESLSILTTDGKALSFNKMPLPKTKQIIPLSVNATASGLYSLQLNEIKNIPSIYRIWLKDAYMKDSLDIRANLNYNLNIDKTNPATFGNDRFHLVISQDPEQALRLLDFQALKVPGSTGVKVEWTVENEVDYTMFYVQRSTDDGKTFESIGSISSSSLGTYSFIDKFPVIGVNKYRLELVDLNRTKTYSKIIPVLLSISSEVKKTEDIISVYPNPTTETINVSVTDVTASSSPSYTITVTNSNGNVVRSTVKAQPNWQTNVNNLMPGTYFVQVTNNSNNKVVGKSKFVKI